MKFLLNVFFLLFASLVFSQAKLTPPDSLINLDFKPITLNLEKWTLNFMAKNERVINNLPTHVRGDGFNFAIRRRTRRADFVDVLNPYGSSDPLGSLLIGTANYFMNKK